MKFRFYIINLEDASVLGTNSILSAMEAAEEEEVIVIDTEDNTLTNCEEEVEIQALPADEEED